MSKTKQFKYKNSIGQDILVDLAVDAANVESTSFAQATKRENLNPGEGLLTLFGKLMKWFSDLKAVAWTGKYADLTDRPALGNAASANIANNLTTEEEGFALDARQGKELNGSLGGCSFEQEGDGFYIIGADAVRKKLGSPVISLGPLVCSSAGNSEAVHDAGGTSEIILDNLDGYENIFIGPQKMVGLTGSIIVDVDGVQVYSKSFNSSSTSAVQTNIPISGTKIKITVKNASFGTGRISGNTTVDYITIS